MKPAQRIGTPHQDRLPTEQRDVPAIDVNAVENDRRRG